MSGAERAASHSSESASVAVPCGDGDGEAVSMPATRDGFCIARTTSSNSESVSLEVANRGLVLSQWRRVEWPAALRTQRGRTLASNGGGVVGRSKHQQPLNAESTTAAALCSEPGRHVCCASRGVAAVRPVGALVRVAIAPLLPLWVPLFPLLHVAPVASDAKLRPRPVCAGSHRPQRSAPNNARDKADCCRPRVQTHAHGNSGTRRRARRENAPSLLRLRRSGRLAGTPPCRACSPSASVRPSQRSYVSSQPRGRTRHRRCQVRTHSRRAEPPLTAQSSAQHPAERARHNLLCDFVF